jgi:RNA polymerase sigma factor (sigma-70 family)
MLSGDTHRADDLVQQTFTKLYVWWPKRDRVQDLDRYVHTMLVREFINGRRLAWSRVQLWAHTPESAALGVDFEGRMVLRAALDRVPRKQRAVLVLRFLCDLPVDEVAQLMNCSNGTVKSQTSHGLAALRRHLGDRSDLTAFAATPKGLSHVRT